MRRSPSGGPGASAWRELRRLREELGLDTVALDLDFLRRYRNSPRVLNYILNDLWSLRMRLRVCVPPGEPLRGLREELEPLRERFLRPGGELEVIVPAAPGEEERARTLAEALSAFRLPGQSTGRKPMRCMAPAICRATSSTPWLQAGGAVCPGSRCWTGIRVWPC